MEFSHRLWCRLIQSCSGRKSICELQIILSLGATLIPPVKQPTKSIVIIIKNSCTNSLLNLIITLLPELGKWCVRVCEVINIWIHNIQLQINGVYGRTIEKGLTRAEITFSINLHFDLWCAFHKLFNYRTHNENDKLTKRANGNFEMHFLCCKTQYLQLMQPAILI